MLSLIQRQFVRLIYVPNSFYIILLLLFKRLRSCLAGDAPQIYLNRPAD